KWLGVEINAKTAPKLPQGNIAIVPNATEGSENSQPLNIEEVVKDFGGDKNMVLRIICEFIDTINAQVTKMRDAIDKGEFDTVRKEAHSIKGGSANINAMDLSRVASELEQAALSEASLCSDLLSRLSIETERLNVYITGLKKTRDQI
ncbi:MAG: Hpt domain-containing protein, partial [Nitrospirae bacterium]|nr:Hpt domain-containing protein [Nitrospirota bacterium]